MVHQVFQSARVGRVFYSPCINWLQILFMQDKEQEWEGFEQFCDAHPPEETKQEIQQQIPQPEERVSTAEPSKDETLISAVQKPKTSPFKKVKPKPKVEQIKANKQSPSRKEESSRAIPCSVSPKKIIKNDYRYERIPIMRKQDEFRFAGSVVYRSFAPRSSETYFRTFKDIDFEAEPTKARYKAGQNYSFNSRFESGNLSMAFQGRRERV